MSDLRDYVSDDVLLILSAGRLLGRRGDERPYEQNATVLCLSVTSAPS